MKILVFPVTAKLFHTDGRTDRQTDRQVDRLEGNNGRFLGILRTLLKVFQTDVVEKIKTHTLCSEMLFRKSCRF